MLRSVSQLTRNRIPVEASRVGLESMGHILPCDLHHVNNYFSGGAYYPKG